MSSEAALFPQDSQIWKISRERVILLVGPAAAILQIAHPVVALGVQNHSRFREDSMTRLRRTLDAVYTATFSPASEAAAMYEIIKARHASVRGTAPRPYSAFSADAQMWVLATLIMLAVEAYERFVEKLHPADKESYYRDMRRFGIGFGLPADYGPQTWEAFSSYYASQISSPEMASQPISRELAQAIAKPERPLYLRPLWPVSVFFTTEFLPHPLADKLGFPTTASQRLWSAALTSLFPSLTHSLPPLLRFEKRYRQALTRNANQR